MITDGYPRRADRRREYEASDQLRTLPLPEPARLQELCAAVEAALDTGACRPTKAVASSLLSFLADFHGVPAPRVSVLGARPRTVYDDRSSYELFGDYTIASQTIRLWMRTAVLGKVTSYRGFLNTLLHEYAHHLDVHSFGLPNTLHTRGFFQRVDDLYHLALGTPPAERRPLAWIKTGNRYRIDWNKTRAPRKR